LHKEAFCHHAVAWVVGVYFPVQLVKQFMGAVELALGKVQPAVEFLLAAQERLQGEQGVEAGQGANVPLVHQQGARVEQDVGQGEPVHVLIFMFVRSGHDKYLAAFNWNFLSVNHVQGGAF